MIGMKPVTPDEREGNTKNEILHLCFAACSAVSGALSGLFAGFLPK
jgi:hypothetical protein